MISAVRRGVEGRVDPLADHQGGVCGHLRVRVTGQHRSSLAVTLHLSGDMVSADGEAILPLRKFAEPLLAVEVSDRGRGLASTTLDLRPLILGATPAVLETLRVLEKPLQLSVAYEPHGIEPRRGHVVRLEAFAPPGVLPATMAVDDDHVPSMPVVSWEERAEVSLGKWETWRCRARVHRNRIFVVDRETWADKLIAPILATDFAAKAIDTARPIATPVIAAAAAATALSWTTIRFVATSVTRNALGAVHSRFFAAAHTQQDSPTTAKPARFAV